MTPEEWGMWPFTTSQRHTTIPNGMTPAEWDAWLDDQPAAVITDSMVAFVGEMVSIGQEISTVQWRWFKEHVENLGGWFE